MTRYVCLYAIVVAMLAGCGASNSVAPAQQPATLSQLNLPAGDAGPRQKLYWTFFGFLPQLQAETTGLPLKVTSTATPIPGNSTNMLNLANAMRFDTGGRLWILAGPSGTVKPGAAMVFDLPFKPTSAPHYVFTLSGTDTPDHLAFDASGNLWVTSQHNNTVFEYNGPFTASGTLVPSTTLTMGINSPSGIAFDSTGSLYVANVTSSGTNSVAVFHPPISNKMPDFLDGLAGPGGLIFDAHGNLYASTYPGGSNEAIVRYNHSNLHNHSKPNIVDTTGLLPFAYATDFALDAKGNLYDADCSRHSARIYVYPLSTKRFSATLAPSVAYSDSNINSINCVWGIAIK